MPGSKQNFPIAEKLEEKMLQIDDAGSGSFVGGTCIGVYRPETNEYYFDIIPVELYGKDNFKKKYYLDEVVNIVDAAFRNLEPLKGETIEICRGYMFERLMEWLENKGYTWYRTQICGRAQQVVEENFELYTERLGLPWQYIKYTRYPFHFHKLLSWVYADYGNRIKLCKVGWQSWQRQAGNIPEILDGGISAKSCLCLKCGKRIFPGDEIKILKYVSNRENLVRLHALCRNTGST
jgi:hypothetical protein